MIQIKFNDAQLKSIYRALDTKPYQRALSNSLNQTLKDTSKYSQKIMKPEFRLSAPNKFLQSGIRPKGKAKPSQDIADMEASIWFTSKTLNLAAFRAVKSNKGVKHSASDSSLPSPYAGSFIAKPRGKPTVFKRSSGPSKPRDKYKVYASGRRTAPQLPIESIKGYSVADKARSHEAKISSYAGLELQRAVDRNLVKEMSRI
jgi:hypothetical protein